MKGIAVDHTMVFKDVESLIKLLSPEPHPEKERILTYLKSREPMAVAPGFAFDVINGNKIDVIAAYTDADFCWQTDSIHYFERYNLALDPEFVQLALNAS